MKGSNYRRPNGMPLTHRDYAGGVPNLRIARFSTGSARKDYEVRLEMRSREMAQIRDNAMEAARVAANKKMNKIGEENYRLTVKQYPHVIISENKMIATAGADRLQEGMRRAYGKPIGRAARVRPETVIMVIETMQDHLSLAKKAFATAGSKMPMPVKVKVEFTTNPGT